MPAALFESGGHGGVAEGSLSRLQLDAQGLLKVHHLLSIGKGAHLHIGSGVHRGGRGHDHHAPSAPVDTLADPEPTAPGGSAAGVGVFAASRELGSSTRIPVTFILRPMDVEDLPLGAEMTGIDDEEGAGGEAASRQRHV